VAILVVEEAVEVVEVDPVEVALRVEVVAAQAEVVRPMVIYPGQERLVQHPLRLPQMLLGPASRRRRLL
jgi:hypothetical protein